MPDDLTKSPEQPSLPPTVSGHDVPPTGPRRAQGGDWTLVPMSGLVAGVAFGIAFAKMGPPSLLLAAVAWIICIQNGNFRYSPTQKTVATVIMLAIGLYGRQILD